MESSVSTTFNLQEQVKAPRIGEPRTQNWTGPQVIFPKTEEPGKSLIVLLFKKMKSASQKDQMRHT